MSIPKNLNAEGWNRKKKSVNKTGLKKQSTGKPKWGHKNSWVRSSERDNLIEGKTGKNTKFNLRKKKILKKKKQHKKQSGSSSHTSCLDHEMEITWLKGNRRKEQSSF